MKRPDNTAPGRKMRMSSSADSLIRDLESEAKSLSPEIVSRLATARCLAVMSSQSHPVIDNVKAEQLHHDNRTPKMNPRPAQAVRRPLRAYLEAVLATRPLTASLAASCVAVVAAMLMFQPPRLANNQTEQIAMTTTPRGQATDTVPADAKTLSAGAASYGASTTEPVPVIVSGESLDMVGSVDFLLWLDSQQS